MKKILFIPAICLLCASFESHLSFPLGYALTQQESSDAEITANIKQRLQEDTSLSAGARRISVTTENGIVTLKGTVATRQENHIVVTMVEEVPGVIRVRNQLFVSHSLE